MRSQSQHRAFMGAPGTVIALISAWVLATVILHAHVTLADELDDIQRDRESAEMQYVNELASGKYKTQKEKDALRAKYLDPQEKRTQEYFKKISTSTATATAAAASQNAEDGSSDNASGGAVNYSPQVDRNMSSGYKGNDQQIDGSYVPKEVVFEPASKKSKPSPTPSSSPVRH